MILPDHVTTSAFYGFVFEDAPLGPFKLVTNPKQRENDRRTQKYSIRWGGLPIPAGMLGEGDRAWVGYTSFHETDPLLVIPDEDKGEPALREPENAESFIPSLYVWHAPCTVARVSGSEKLFLRDIPMHFILPLRWRERNGRDVPHPPTWHVWKQPETGILLFAAAQYAVTENGERTYRTIHPL